MLADTQQQQQQQQQQQRRQSAWALQAPICVRAQSNTRVLRASVLHSCSTSSFGAARLFLKCLTFSSSSFVVFYVELSAPTFLGTTDLELHHLYPRVLFLQSRYSYAYTYDMPALEREFLFLFWFHDFTSFDKTTIWNLCVLFFSTYRTRYNMVRTYCEVLLSTRGLQRVYSYCSTTAVGDSMRDSS